VVPGVERSEDFVSSALDDPDGYVTTAPVGSYLPNPWGLHDMLGNMDEWCRDGYAEVPWSSPQPALLEVDPTGPVATDEHVVRSSFCLAETSYARCAGRYGLHRHGHLEVAGVRLVVDVDPDIGSLISLDADPRISLDIAKLGNPFRAGLVTGELPAFDLSGLGGDIGFEGLAFEGVQQLARFHRSPFFEVDPLQETLHPRPDGDVLVAEDLADEFEVDRYFPGFEDDDRYFRWRGGLGGCLLLPRAAGRCQPCGQQEAKKFSFHCLFGLSEGGDRSP